MLRTKLASFYILTFVAAPAMAKDAVGEIDDKAIIGFQLENDIFSNTDKHYTNGFRLFYISSENKLSDWIGDAAEDIPFYLREGEKRYGFAIGQSMFTPNDITLKNPPASERPYAGWLHADFSVTSDSDDKLDFVELSLGVVGPSSLADGTQDFVHHLINADDPQGWDRQLKDEPAIMLSYQRKWKDFWKFNGSFIDEYQVDVMPHIGASLGNVFTQAAAGATFRIGQDLPSDYGPPLIRPSLGGSDFFEPSDNFGWYLFAGLEARAVGRNIFLDGNSFSDNSPTVDKKHFVGDAQLGFAVTYDDYRFAYTHIFRSKEFETQQNSDSFGSLNISMRFLVVRVLILFAFLMPATANAGAWLQEEGKTEAILNYVYFNTSSFYDGFGDENRGNAFGKNELNPYIEHGLYEDVTIGSSVSFQAVATNMSVSFADSGNMVLSYVNLFARTYLIENDDYVISIEPRLQIPINADAALNPEGDDIIPELKLGFGAPFKLPFTDPFGFSEQYHFIDVGAVYRKRDQDSFDRDLNDMLKLEATAGFRYDDETMVMAQLFHEESLGRKAQDNTAGNYNLTKLQLSVAYEYWDDIILQAGAFSNVDGVNTVAGNGLQLSVWYRF